MATITPTFNKTNNCIIVTWKNMSSADTAIAHAVLSKHVDPCVQFEGTFAGGTTATMQGSISGTAYSPCLNSVRAAASATAAALAEITTSTPYYKPVVTAGTGDSVTISLIYWIR